MEEVGRFSRVDIDCNKDDDGAWKVIVTLTERRLLKGKEWEEVKVDSSCTDNEFESAYTVAMQSALNKLNDLLDQNDGKGIFPEIKDSEETEDTEKE